MLEVVPGPLLRAAGDTVVLPLPSGERPLGKDAGALDWRLDGAISQQLESGYLQGDLGEISLMPGRPPLEATRVLLVGIGDPATAERAQLRAAFEAVADRLLGLRCERALLASPAALDAACADVLLEGCVDALARAPRGATLALTVAGEEAARLWPMAVGRVSVDAERRRVQVSAVWPEA